MHPFKSTIVIAIATALESVRNRVLLVTAFFGVVLVAISVLGASLSYKDQHRLVIDVGLAAASLLGMIMGIALTITSYASELKNRTVYTLFARPMPRWCFILGKYLGLTAVLQAVVAIMWGSTAVVVLMYGGSLPGVFVTALWCTCLEVAIVVAVTLMFSTMAVPTLAATYAAGVLLAGSFASDLPRLALQLYKESPASSALLHTLYYLLPDLDRLSVRLQAANDLPLPVGFVTHATFYAVAYGAVWLVLAMAVLTRRKDV